MTPTSLSTPVLTAIAEPLTMMGASWKATTANAGFAVLAVLFLGSVWSILASFVFFQILAIVFTYRDCHFMEVMMASFKCPKTPLLLPQVLVSQGQVPQRLVSQRGHRYVG